MASNSSLSLARAAVRATLKSIDSPVLAKGLSAGAGGASYKLPDLAYDYGALEPVISGEIMQLHHSKHHQTYVNGLNATMEKIADAESKGDVAAVVALQPALKFHGGGHVNHSIFWSNLAPTSSGGGSPPCGPLADAIEAEFGGLDAFISSFNAKTAAVQGSGWGWLAMNPATKKLSIQTCPNQDPLSLTGLVPIIGIDVWEHSYYLQYKNDRGAYLKEIWKVVNWGNAAERYSA